MMGSATDFAVFKPHEERLSNLVESFPELHNPITAYLQAKPDDSAAEGRLKNSLEGLLLGAISEPFIHALRTLKYARIKWMAVEVRTRVHYELEAVMMNLNKGINKIPNIKGTQVGLRNLEQVDVLKEEMLNGNFEFSSLRGKIAGFIDKKGNYYVSEGHHRMAAAQDIYKSTGDRSYIDKLLENGKWDLIDKAPNNMKPLPIR